MALRENHCIACGKKNESKRGVPIKVFRISMEEIRSFYALFNPLILAVLNRPFPKLITVTFYCRFPSALELGAGPDPLKRFLYNQSSTHPLSFLDYFLIW